MPDRPLDVFFNPRLDIKRFSQWLDGLASPERVRVVRTMTARQQADLFDAAAGFGSLTLDDIVPAAMGNDRTVIHAGRNSLLAFRYFEKRFVRPPANETGGARELWGYNHNPAIVEWFGGPGYFVAYEILQGEILVDYTRVPPRSVVGWPRVAGNRARGSMLIYYNTQDTLRRVSRHVSIGRAARRGKVMDNWFVLCRVET